MTRHVAEALDAINSPIRYRNDSSQQYFFWKAANLQWIIRSIVLKHGNITLSEEEVTAGRRSPICFFEDTDGNLSISCKDPTL